MPPRIEVDAEIADLIPEFLSDRTADVASIRTHLIACDWEPIRVLGHNMKGMGGSYGFEAISVFGSRIELAAHNADPMTVEQVTDQLAAYLETLEVVTGDGEVLAVGRATPGSAHEGAGLRILLIEDSSAVQAIVRRTLEKAGYQVLGATGSHEALELATALKPVDLVIVDISLPTSHPEDPPDGLALTGRLRITGGWEDVPVLILTASGDRDAVLRAFQLGAGAYLKKPVDPALLLDRIKTLLPVRGAGGSG